MKRKGDLCRLPAYFFDKEPYHSLRRSHQFLRDIAANYKNPGTSGQLQSSSTLVVEIIVELSLWQKVWPCGLSLAKKSRHRPTIQTAETNRWKPLATVRPAPRAGSRVPRVTGP